MMIDMQVDSRIFGRCVDYIIFIEVELMIIGQQRTVVVRGDLGWSRT
jgi:hypothetical protein